MVDDQHSDKKPEGRGAVRLACRCSSSCLDRAALLSAPVDDDAAIEPTHGRRACLIIKEAAFHNTRLIPSLRKSDGRHWAGDESVRRTRDSVCIVPACLKEAMDVGPTAWSVQSLRLACGRSAIRLADRCTPSWALVSGANLGIVGDVGNRKRRGLAEFHFVPTPMRNVCGAANPSAPSNRRNASSISAQTDSRSASLWSTRSSETSGRMSLQFCTATASEGNRRWTATASTATSRNPARSKTLVKKTVHAVPVSGLVSAAAVQILPSERHVRTSGDANAHSSAG